MLQMVRAQASGAPIAISKSIDANMIPVMARGSRFAISNSLGKLFAAGLTPGLMLASIYIIYILVRCRLNPTLGPPADEQFTATEKLKSLRFLIAPGILIVAVLGCIIGGVTSPSEASAIGAFGALLIAAVQRRLDWPTVRYVMLSTTKIMGMLMWITIAAVFFSKIYVGVGAGRVVSDVVESLDLSPNLVILAMLATYFVLGMFLDDFAIVFITVPLFIPIVTELGFDTTWFAILFVLSMQSAYLTPPFGYNLFYMRSVAPAEITTMDIYRSAVPFVIMQMIGLGLVFFFPQIALWLPNMLF